MKGQVVSYMTTKGFGFINGDDNESYFFHKTYLNNLDDESKLAKGTVLIFNPIPSPKGLAAKNIIIADVYWGKKLVEFFITKNHLPKHGLVERKYTIKTRFFKDLNKAKKNIDDLAKEVGCNAILGLTYEKKTRSSGDYQYTVHAFKADLALVSENVPYENQVDEIVSHNKMDKLVEEFDSKFIIDNTIGSKASGGQFNTYCGVIFVIITFVMFMVLSS